MSCPTYKTDKGLQIGGIDPTLVEKAVKTEVKTDEIPLEDKTPVEAEAEVKEVKKTPKKPTKKPTKKR